MRNMDIFFPDTLLPAIRLSYCQIIWRECSVTGLICLARRKSERLKKEPSGYVWFSAV